MPKNNNIIVPGKTIGIIGGGQLGRMMAIAAKYMGYRIVVLDPTPNCPTAQVADRQITSEYDDLTAIKQLIEQCDVVTYEFENVDLTAAKYIESEGKLPQGAELLAVTQNRDQEKGLMDRLGLPVAPFFVINDAEECEDAIEKIGYPAVVKTSHGGYDGKGQFKFDSKADLDDVRAFVREQNQRCIMEKWVHFDREISVIFTRSESSEIVFFPIAENKHRTHILDETTVPARISEAVAEKAKQATKKIAEQLHVVGTFAIEMFVARDDIYLNEMAPRPHNSGHHTIESCNISQFSQHIRAICGLPLMEVNLKGPAAMVNILGEQMNRLFEIMPWLRNEFIHLYGKAEAKEKRKMGHVTYIASTEAERDELVVQFKEDIR